MRRIYLGLARRQSLILKKAKVAITAIDTTEQVVALIGFATFFFGFAAGAVVNLYLIAINHPLVHQFRTALTYKSAILGDGLLLPIVNMIAASFLLGNWHLVQKKTLQLAVAGGVVITAWFHINQALGGIVNWAMPAPWHWNILGVWHMLYMFFVASFLSLFYLVAVKYVREEKEIPLSVLAVSLGMIVFFALLRLDYIALDLTQLFPL